MENTNNSNISEYCYNCKKAVPAILNINDSNWTIHCFICSELISNGNINDLY